jgi:hypothetical protein
MEGASKIDMSPLVAIFATRITMFLDSIGYNIIYNVDAKNNVLRAHDTVIVWRGGPRIS